jgi:cytochrome c oxidase subunit 4
VSETSTAVEPSHGHALMEGHSDLPMLPGEEHPHPSPFQYVVIAVVLCVITGIEIGAYYLDKAIPDGALTAILVVSAIAKFFIVASWYMHLKTDKPIFRRFFILGITGTMILYTIVLLTLSGLPDK